MEGPTPSRFCFSGLGVLFELGVLSLPGNATAGLRDPPLCAVALNILAAYLEQVSAYEKVKQENTCAGLCRKQVSFI